MSYLRILLCLLVVLTSIADARSASDDLFFVSAKAKDKKERTKIANAGIAIDGVLSDSVTFLASSKEIAALKKLGVSLEAGPLPTPNRDFPTGDAAFHNYDEVRADLDQLAKDHPNVVQRISIGKSVEGRDLAGVRLSSNPTKDSLPTAIFTGCHHAREHLSVEMPLMLAKHLAAQYQRDARIRALLDNHEVWIVPMINPDGAEYDIASREDGHDHDHDRGYKYWRKNRKDNGDGTFGVDLNRNYGGPGWGGEGSSASTSSDIFHGKEAFSEPETLAVRDFVRSRKLATVLLTYHTFSELILWPWGHTDDSISNEKDRDVFETMGKKMASWNKYTPQKSSELYITSGDTTDWAYDELKLFAFTFELSPSSMFGGGFYPGAKAIEPTFQANLEPALYLIGNSANPYAVTQDVRDPLALVH